MVARGRLLAIWFVSILVLSVIPLQVPGASAGAPSNITVEVLFPDGTNVPSSHVLKIDDFIKFRVRATAAQCTGTLEEDVTPTVNATIHAAGRIGNSHVNLTLAKVGAPMSTSYEAVSSTFQIQSTYPGWTGRIAIPSYVTVACVFRNNPPNPPTTDTVRMDSLDITVDTVRPLLAGTSAITRGPAQLDMGASALGANSQVTFTLNQPVDANPIVSVTLDSKEINADVGAASAVPVDVLALPGSYPKVVTLTVNDSRNPGTPYNVTLTGTATVYLRATDASGNVGTLPFTFAVDNQVPVTAPTPTGRSILYRNLSSPGVAASASVLPKFTLPGDAAKGQVVVDGVPVALPLVSETSAPVPPLISNPLGNTPAIRLRSVDAAGNYDPTVLSSPLVFPRLTSFTFGLNGGIPALVPGNKMGNVQFTLADDLPTVANYYNDTNMTLELVGKGFLKVGAAGSDPATHFSYAATDHTFRAGANRPNGASIEFTNLSSGVNLADGNYVLTITANGTSGNQLVQRVPFSVDSGAPSITGPTGSGGIAIDARTAGGDVKHGMDGAPVDLALRVTDSNSGIAKVSVSLLNLDLTQATSANGSDAKWSYAPTACVPSATCGPGAGSATFSADGKTFSGTISVSAFGMPPGSYRIRVQAEDNAGNVAQTPDAPDAALFTVVPRAALVANEGLPFAGPSKILVSGLAAVDLLPVNQSGKTCVADVGGGSPTVCRVTSVTFYARNRNADGTATEERALGPGAINLVGIEPVEDVTVPIAGHPAHTFRMFNVTVQGGFDYPTTAPVVVPTKPVQVRMKAVVSLGATSFEADSGWVNASSLSQPSMATTGVSMQGWKFNTTGIVDYNVTFDLKGPGTPVLNYTLKRVAPDGAVTNYATVGPKYADGTLAGTMVYFTSTLQPTGGALPAGEYTVVFDAYLRDNATFTDYPKASITRHFAVITQAEKPTIAFGDQPTEANATRRAGTNIFDVGASFNMSFRVNHGLLNLTSLSNLSFELTRSVARDSAGTVLANDKGGFNVTILGTSALDQPRRSQTNVTIRVTLPPTAQDGDGFALRLSAATDGQWTANVPADASWYVASATASLKLDKALPVVGVLDAETNATGDSPQLRVHGTADDLGSGVEEVFVRVVDLTRGRTVLWQGAAGPLFAPGESDAPDAWATSKLVPDGTTGPGARWMRNVYLVNDTASHAKWFLNQTDRPVLLADGSPDPSGARFRPLSEELDNGSLYRIDVRARDALGNLVQIKDAVSREVRFDVHAPLIAGVDEGSGIAISSVRAGEVGWHGSPDDATFSVTVSDNKCLKRVSLRGTTPAGTPFGPVDMRPVQPYACTEAMRGQPVAWTLTAREAPALADAVGVNRYHVEAEDATGLVSRGPTSGSLMATLRVVDTLPPVVRYVNPDPPLVGEDATSAIRAEVFENFAIDKVEVFVSRMGVGASLTPLANGTMKASGAAAANGTALYVAETGADLGLSLKKGDYLVQVRARDAAGTCGSASNPCTFVNAILRVSDAAPPAITEEGPARSFVNATPTLAYRITDRSVQQSGVQVRAGNATANLTAVNATLTPLPGAAGARVGFLVGLAPRDLVTGEKLVVELRAAGNLTATREFTYTVDGAPPAVAHNVTGLATLGDAAWGTALTRVFVNATDNASGLASVTYLVNGAAVTATSPLTPSGADGAWTLDYVATDNASNVARGRVAVNLDRLGPSVQMSRQGDDVVLLVTDAGAGLDEASVTAHYAYNGSTVFLTKKMERATGTANAFTASLGGNASASGLSYWFDAKDRLGNVGRLYDATTPHVIPKDDSGLPGNTAPTVRILSPAAGASVRGPVEIKWTAFDNESQPLTVTVALQEPGKPAPRSLMVDAPDNGTYALNATGFAAGTYRVTVVVSDGHLTSSQETRAFVVEAGKTVSVIVPIPGTVEANKETPFQVQLSPVGKTIKAATFTVTRDGQPYSSGTLRPSGVYHEGSVTPDGPGAYKVSVLVSYADNTQDAPVQIASFSVAAPPAEAATPVSFIALLAVAALTVALAAWGAYGRWR